MVFTHCLFDYLRERKLDGDTARRLDIEYLALRLKR